MSSQPRPAQARTDNEPDRCDPAQGQHVFQSYIREAHETLSRVSGSPRRLMRPNGRTIAATDAATLTPSLPSLLADLSVDPPGEALIVVPGQVIDAGRARHRLALVQLSSAPLDAPALAGLVPPLLSGLLPGRRYRLIPMAHTLLKQSMALEIHGGGNWQPLGHCGVIEGGVLEAAGLPVADHAAVAIELGLEQLHGLRGPVGVSST
ncbi:hypothetical protein H0Z60_01470 [Ectothiorhodospiraceae bacterium WFHF3C12]|nr:hypothetical protein [Ectothiorhodospiraceae bacterium WFHF3C12]